MCGIAGFFSARSTDYGKRLVGEIVDSQRNRGPDFQAVDSVTVTEGELILGHNRLSIIDLSAEANQPIWDTEHNVGLIFNGEIYNYIELRDELLSIGTEFRTQSDTEVLIEAYKHWGMEFLPRLNGMFAFAIYDCKSAELLLVRDRFGVKPLHVFQDERQIAFASTGFCLARHFGLNPSWEYVHKGVSTWNFDDDSELSQYDGLTSLPPGTWLKCSITKGGLVTEAGRWYDLEARALAARAELAALSEAELAHRVLETLNSACEIRLRADVPVAVALSGGLDSGAIAVLASRMNRNLRAFSFGDPDDDESEGPIARRLSDSSGIGISFIKPDVHAVIDAFSRTLEAQDAPFVSVSQVAQFMVAEQVKAEGFKVLLGGQGGDEAFMGYRKYFVFLLRHLVAQKRFAEAISVGASLAVAMTEEVSQLGLYWRHKSRFSGKADRKSVFKWPEEFSKPAIGEGGEPWRRQMQDISKFSLPTLLRYEDRNSMAHSVETRLPFLDYRLLEIGLGCSEKYKVVNGYGKWIVRKAMEDLLPDEVRVSRRKVGFAVDQAHLLQVGLGDVLRGWIRDGSSRVKELTQPGFNVDSDFSNQRLAGDVFAMPELISLAWMLRRSE